MWSYFNKGEEMKDLLDADELMVFLILGLVFASVFAFNEFYCKHLFEEKCNKIVKIENCTNDWAAGRTCVATLDNGKKILTSEVDKFCEKVRK